MTHASSIPPVSFLELMQLYKPVVIDADYIRADMHITLLQQVARLSNSCISVYDLNKYEHIYYSANYGQLLGYTDNLVNSAAQEFFDAKIHPGDKIALDANGMFCMKLFMQFTQQEKNNYKLINEFRILNAAGSYVRVIEQHQALELDAQGNLWLTLSFIDISPNQESYEGVKSQLLNFRNGEIISLPATPTTDLTKREIEILKLVKEGLLSKEISDRLSISVHTVNTHRQRFLEKLGANNSMEAVILASRLGLLD